MATGASNSDLAVILIDARKGVLTQTRRHAYIVSLLGIRHVVLAVNKIDLVDFSQGMFDGIAAEFRDFAAAARLRQRRARSRSRRATATTSSRRASARPGTRARRCSHIWRRSTSRPTLASQAVPHAGAMGEPPESRFPRLLRHHRRAACVKPGDAIVGRASRAARRTVTRIVTAGRRSDRSGRRRRRSRWCSPTKSTSRAATCWCAPDDAPGSVRPIRRASALDGGRGDAAGPPISDQDRQRNRCRRRSPSSSTRSTSTRWSTSPRRRSSSTRSATAISRRREADRLRRLSRQSRHRRLHPDRPLHQRDGRRRHDRVRPAARHQRPLAGARRERAGARRPQGPEALRALVHRPVGLGQIDHRQSGREARCSAKAATPICSTATMSATASTAISASPMPTASRTSAASAKRRNCSSMPA